MFSLDEYTANRNGPSALSPTKSTQSNFPSPNSSLSPNDSNKVPNSRLQIIDEDKHFTPDLEKYLRDECKILNVGMDYNVVAVFGSQSTGKSTLLNRLFDTTFDVMNETRRSQTTKGIWLAKSSASDRNLLVLDLEGTDGRERGEDQDFERKSSLFALAIAEVVIINMWESAVGLYHGANMALLKTVLEAHLQIFQKEGSPKTHLFFVIRDHCSETPLASLAETLRADLNTMWTSMQPPHPMEHYFTISFASLPHKRLLPEPFEQAVGALRERFVHVRHPSYVFQPAFHKQVPMDGFPRYSEAIWDQIQTHADLDVPTQQELLSQFRCDALMDQAEATFLDGVRALPTDVAVEGHVLDTLLDAALAMYDPQARRYAPAIYTKTRESLTARMRDTHGLRVFEHGLRKLHQKVLAQFPELLDAQMLQDTSTTFYDALQSVRTTLVTRFKDKVRACLMKDAAWPTEEIEQQLTAELDELVQAKHKQALERQLETTLARYRKDLKENLDSMFRQKKPPAEFGAKVDALLTHLQDLAVADFKTVCSETLHVDDVAGYTMQLRDPLFEEFKHHMETQTQDAVLCPRLRGYFEELFRFDADGLPRFWKPTDDMAAVYRHARSVVMRHVTQLAQYTFPGAPDVPLLDAARLAEVTTRFKLEADVMYMEAKRSLLLVSAQVPKWLLLALVALGWNELMYVLSSPFLLLVVLLAAVGIYVLVWTGLAGPVVHVLTKVYQEVSTQLIQRFTDASAGATESRRDTIKQHIELAEMKGTRKSEAEN